MNEVQTKSRLLLFRMIPLLMLISFIGWCSTSNRDRKQLEPIRTELIQIFMEEGLIDGPANNVVLADVAKKVGQPGMNRVLYAAAPTAGLDALKWLIQNGADPKNVGAMHNATLLQQVAKTPKFDRLEYFLSLGLDPLETSRDGRTLLHIAAEGGLDERILALLRAKGLKLTDTTPSGSSAIHFASVKSIPVLIAAGMNVDAMDASRRTALHDAALQGKGELVAELLRANASVFAQDNKGQTPLHLASLKHADAVIDALLAAGAPRTVRDSEGNTPKDLYDQREHRERRPDMSEAL